MSKSIPVFAAAIIAIQCLSISAFADNRFCYILREQNGKIVLLEEGSEQPLAVYKTPINSLNPADAELICEGIRLKNGGEVSRLIEDLELE